MTNYILGIIIVIIIIGAEVLAYSKFGKKTKEYDDYRSRHPVSFLLSRRVSGTVNHDVIISDSSLDKPTADAVCAGLEMRGSAAGSPPGYPSRCKLPGSNYRCNHLK